MPEATNRSKPRPVSRARRPRFERPYSKPAAILKGLYALAMCAAVYFRVHLIISPLLLPAILFAALWRGRWEERAVATALIVSFEILELGPHYGLFAHTYDIHHSRVGVLVVGVAYLAVLLVVALRSRLWWPSWTAAFQSLIVASHVIFMARGGAIEPWAYTSSVIIWTWLQLIALTFGVFDAWAERRLQSAKGGPRVAAASGACDAPS